MGVRLYKHTNCRDTAIEIKKSYFIPEKDGWSMKVMWWNIGPHKPFCMAIQQRVFISKEAWKNWKEYTWISN